MKLTVTVVNFNKPKLTILALNLIQQNLKSAEIAKYVIVNNGKIDNDNVNYDQFNENIRSKLQIIDNTNAKLGIYPNKDILKKGTNADFRHSTTIQYLIDNCETDYMLLIDHDFFLKKDLDFISELDENQDIAGAFSIHSFKSPATITSVRAIPYLMLINVKFIKHKKIVFFDKELAIKCNPNPVLAIKCITGNQFLANLNKNGIKYKTINFEDYGVHLVAASRKKDDQINQFLQKNSIQYSENKDIKFIAWYLPQFHVIPENNSFWGKGFTEWTNVKKAMPLYTNHYQPRLPHNDIGFYNLSDWHILQQQAIIARQYSIYGFCFYRYWFDGKSLLQKPLDLLLEHPEIDINYCLCWANENWTRAWDGHNKDILIEQTYSNDSVQYIADIEKYLKDPRYIKNNNKPVILVYKPYDLPNPAKTFELWRKYAREHGIGEIEIYAQSRMQNNLNYDSCFIDGIDAEVEFPPNDIMLKKYKLTRKHVHICDYQKLVDCVLSKKAFIENLKHRTYRGVMLSFDNTPRNKNGVSYVNFSFQLYEKWLNYAIDWTKEKYKNSQYDKYVFINAWNEWGEGTYLEPDQKFGYTALNITSNALKK